ncbi:hypothetical protein FISHEDRAFT_77928 [Fistulina hepatica ATCC 64428]|nr:hypothetical protein FISHEDRAFT_77928 [Fistulina hepatica ATCC 64428]
MAPGRTVQDIKITVPRLNAEKVTKTRLLNEVKAQSSHKGGPADLFQIDIALSQAAENASEWNSLLTTARADRGPQWDIGTQQFLVEEYSELYYDPSLLLEIANKALLAEEDGESEPPASGAGVSISSAPKSAGGSTPHPSHSHHTRQRNQTPQTPQFSTPVPQPPQSRPPLPGGVFPGSMPQTPLRGSFPGGAHAGFQNPALSPSQFFGAENSMRMNPMGLGAGLPGTMAQGMAPPVAHGLPGNMPGGPMGAGGMSMPMGNMGINIAMGGGGLPTTMHGIPGSISPDMRRRLM